MKNLKKWFVVGMMAALGSSHAVAQPPVPHAGSPGEADRFAAADACPTFSWGLVPAADRYEIAVFREAHLQREDSPQPVLEGVFSAGISSWTPPSDACLEAGGRYVWMVRNSLDEAWGDWSEPRFFAVVQPPYPDGSPKLERLLEVLAADPLVLQGHTAAKPSGSARVNAGQAESRGLEGAIQIDGSPIAAVRGEAVDASGEAYGVHGIAQSADGAGVRAENANTDGADLLLAGTNPTRLTEEGVMRESDSDLTFLLENRGAGSLVLQVDGVEVVTTETDSDTQYTAGEHLALNGTTFNVTDGRNSSLDADKLDGMDSSEFAASGHDHDTRYFTESELATAGDSTVHWSNLAAVPPDLADGDNDTQYAAGNQLSLQGTTFDVLEGAGSGLDADTLDGRQASDFVTTGTDLWVNTAGDTMTGDLVLSNGAILDFGDALLKSGRRFIHNDFGNTALGLEALSGLSSSGTKNTAVGNDALDRNTIGDNNTAVGDDALNGNQTGSNNTAIGENSLNDNQGSLNTAVGQASLEGNTTADSNTAVGWRALRRNVTGSENTAIGSEALRSNANGRNNTAVGEDALALSTGDNNIALGENAGASITTGSQNIMIGTSGGTSDDRVIRIGVTQNRTFIAGVRGVTTGSSGAMQVLVDGSGQLGTASSSRHFKTDVRDVGRDSRALLDLRPVSFYYRQHVEQEAPVLPDREYGLIAEEVAAVFPELVVHDEHGQPTAVKYRLLSSLLLNEVKRQSLEIEQIRKTLARLSSTLGVAE